MKNYRIYSIVLASGLIAPGALTQTSPEQMTQELNAKGPEWLSLGVPIKAEPVTSLPGDPMVFRSRSGGATNSRYRVQIPSRGIQMGLGYEIDWTGNDAVGTGVSLSPDGTRLVVNTGPTSHLYAIERNGSFSEVPVQLPHVTYDPGRKGYLRRWSWADDQTLVAQAKITDETGDEVVENRLYVFHTKERMLSRIDLSALNLTDADGIELVGIGTDLSQLKLSIGNAVVLVKADLKSPPKLDNTGADAPTAAAPLVAPKPVPPKPRESKPTPSEASQEPLSATPRSMMLV